MKGLTHEQSKQLRAKIIEYRKQGHYRRECCEYFNVKESYVDMACRGIKFDWKYDRETQIASAKALAASKPIDESIAVGYVERFIPWAEYVSGYKNCSGHMNIRCLKCGNVFDVSCTTVRQGKRVECPKCKNIAREKKRTDRQEIARVKRISKMKCVQTSLKVCKACGIVYADNKRTEYCSNECLQRVSNSQRKDKRLRKINSRPHDNDITLEKLYEKSNGICALCGACCDWSDYIVRDDGTFIANNHYPSIDHIVPLSKGGTHTWENVQLACRICNTKKRNLTPLPCAADR